MNIKVSEISSLIAKEIKDFKNEIDYSNDVGTVVTIGDGIALLYGLDNAMLGELLLFSNNVYGMVMNLEEAKDFVAQCFNLDHEGAENLAKAKAEALGIKLGDFMMPVRMAVTGSRVSPPLIGSILVLGKERALARIERTLASL